MIEFLLFIIALPTLLTICGWILGIAAAILILIVAFGIKALEVIGGFIGEIVQGVSNLIMSYAPQFIRDGLDFLRDWSSELLIFALWIPFILFMIHAFLGHRKQKKEQAIEKDKVSRLTTESRSRRNSNT